MPRKAEAKDFNFHYSQFPSCCGSGIIHSFALMGFPAPYLSKEAEVDWNNLDEDFFAGVTKRFDLQAGTLGAAHIGVNLVAITIPYYGDGKLIATGVQLGAADKQGPSPHGVIIERILERTGWVKGIKALGTYGNHQQFWMRVGPKKQIKE